MTPIAPHIEAFLRENLSPPRYRPTHTRFLWVQLPAAVSAGLGVTPSSLALEQLDSGLVSAFLEYLEDTRRNAPETRNVRLAAIASFFRFPEYRPACRARSNPSCDRAISRPHSRRPGIVGQRAKSQEILPMKILS